MSARLPLPSFPPEAQVFGLSCLDIITDEHVIVVAELRDFSERDTEWETIGEFRAPAECHGWTGLKPLTRMAREMRAARSRLRNWPFVGAVRAGGVE